MNVTAETIKLLDLASPQGVIPPEHWPLIRADGVRGIYAKCGNGNDRPDPTFAPNVAGARTVDIAPGYYAVGFPLPDDAAHPGRDAISQAEAHFAQAEGLGLVLGDLRPVLDFEWPLPVDWPRWGVTAHAARAWGLAWLTRTEELSGRTPMVYLYPDWAIHLFAAATEDELAAYTRFPLWIARYGVQQPGTLSPWLRPTCWQKSDGGARLPSGAPVDEDVFLGDEAAWEAFRYSP